MHKHTQYVLLESQSNNENSLLRFYNSFGGSICWTKKIFFINSCLSIINSQWQWLNKTKRHWHWENVMMTQPSSDRFLFSLSNHQWSSVLAPLKSSVPIFVLTEDNIQPLSLNWRNIIRPVSLWCSRITNSAVTQIHWWRGESAATAATATSEHLASNEDLSLLKLELWYTWDVQFDPSRRQTTAGGVRTNNLNEGTWNRESL
jgi:hypothetical protein